MTIIEGRVTADDIARAVHTEDTALELFYILLEKFGWAGTVFSRNDVPLIIHEENIPGESEFVDEPVTEEEFAAVCEKWEWKEGITEAMTANAAEIIPVVHRNQDGTFEVRETW